jgi:uncharacterized membrane protein
MTPNVPWHPLIVHLPLALALLMPLLAAAALLAWWRRWAPGRPLWAAVVALQALLLGAGLAAQRSGEQEEERVEAVVAADLIEQHEEAAEVFVIAAGVVLGFALTGLLVPGERARRGVALVAAAGTVVVLGLAYRVGRAGGELVYVHGAASAYATGGNAAAGGSSGAIVEDGAEHDD